MMKTKKNLGRRINSIIVTAIVVAVFCFAIVILLDRFAANAKTKQMILDSTITTCSNYIEALTIYGNNYFELGDDKNDSSFFCCIKYDEVSNRFSMDNIDITKFETGNITGIGELPKTGKDREEMNLALNFNEFFTKFYYRLPEIAWLYYCSDKDFVIIYPWIDSTDFRYEKNLKEMEYYVMNLPDNNPTRELRWTSVYKDAAGKGLMVTLASPIYNGDEFVGVVALDLTTQKIGNLFQSAYDGYLVSGDDVIITAHGKDSGKYRFEKLSSYVHLTDNGKEKLADLDENVVKIVDGYFVYKSHFIYAPWDMVMVLPIYIVLLEAFAITVPVILIAALLFVAFREIKHRKEIEEKIESLSITDSLTGLKNRRYLDTIFKDEVIRADRYNLPLSAIMTDLDHFKKINDTWGHPAGDEVLRQVARILEGSIRKSDILARMGGEEFLIILPYTPLLGARELAEKIRQKIESSVKLETGKCTASFGVVEKLPNEQVEEIYKRVDEVLYKAKVGGRNKVEWEESKSLWPIVTARLKWSREFESGEATIDQQHRELLEVANYLITMSFSEYSREKIGEQITLLIRQLEEHFQYEENMQKEIGYPYVTEHANIHKELEKKVRHLQKIHSNGEMKISEVFTFMLDDVIVGHMLKEDINFYPYLKKYLGKEDK